MIGLGKDRIEKGSISLELTIESYHLLINQIPVGKRCDWKAKETDSGMKVEISSHDLSLLLFTIKAALFVPDPKQKELLQQLYTLLVSYELQSPPYSKKEGQYLSYIYYYHKLHGKAPAYTDFIVYFKAYPSTVHSTILRLERKGFIKRTPKTARSIRLLVAKEDLPELE